ncbi:MAG: MFS transporter [Candidatus Andeanibacterium colombiense]|uniref:MFS transporter n=1 Tax=Candidatus Andeanibacterium colombiense TaxID=3121345 RepID=A0AAJ5X9D9_9SPHN|nr:MAG: MFS transporter [Sphingomonadaceae bacterium]
MKRFLTLKSRDVVIVVAASMFMAQLDGAVLAIALPEISRALNVSVVSLSLSITIYLTMLVAMLPISGWAADRFGPRRIFLIATVGFALFSAMCAVAESYWLFILARALQGAAAALLTPVGRLILLRETPKDELVDALSITAMPMLIAPTIGPSLGGFIVEYARWEYIFLLNLPIAAALFMLARLRIPAIPPDPSRKFDIVGTMLLSSALICLLTGFDRLTGGVLRPLPWALLAFGGVLAWATLRHIRRHPDPIVSLEAMRIPGFRTAAVGAGAAVRLPARAMLLALPLMFQLGFGFSPFVAGLLLIALNGGDLLTKPVTQPAYQRFGYRETVIWSSLAGLVALAVIALASPGRGLVPLLLVALIVVGISRSFVFTGMASLSFATLTKAHLSSGNVVANVSMQLVNAVAISATAVIVTLSAEAGGRAEPAVIDYRIALIAIVAIGLVSTIRLRSRLPRDLQEIHAEEAA